jgi:hypothetical protein
LTVADSNDGKSAPTSKTGSMAKSASFDCSEIENESDHIPLINKLIGLSDDFQV